MNIKSETGTAVNIMVALGSVSSGYTRQELVKKTRLNTTRCYKVLSGLVEHGLVDIDKTNESESRYIYTITKPADMITLKDVFEIYEGTAFNGVCLFCGRGCRKDEGIEKCPFTKEVLALFETMDAWMRGITIQELVLRGDDYFERMFKKSQSIAAAKKKKAKAPSAG